MTARATGAAPLRLVLASNNARKLAEMRALLDGLALELVPQGELGIPEADEPHGTFVENALAKARAAARASGGAALADDSGLVVPALGGEPGVVSAEYAGPVPAAGVPDREARRRQQDEANNALLLQRLHGVPDRGGFGYDPLLWIPALGASVAELDPARKNRHSHRAQAAAQMRELLRVQWDL